MKAFVCRKFLMGKPRGFPISYFLLFCLLGFTSGLPLLLVGGTLQAWGTHAGLGLMMLGYLTLVGQPYAYKFLWAPLLDKYSIPFWHGHRRGWVLLLMLLVIVGLSFLSFAQPERHIGWFVSWAVIVAVCSASLDAAIDAFRISFLAPEEYGLGNASYVTGYRISMLVSGGLALIIADRYGWRFTYQAMVVLMILSFCIFLCTKEPIKKLDAPKTVCFKQSLWQPFQNLFQKKSILLMLLFVILYKFGEALGTALTTPFLLHELHFSLTVLGGVYKTIGLIATLIGAFVGGYCYKRYTLYPALLVTGFLQAFCILLYAWLAHVGHSFIWMTTTVAAESCTSGMATTVFIAFLMRLCNPLYIATQYALLSACASIGRIVTGPLASLLVLHYHWTLFFIISFFTCMPGLILLVYLKKFLKNLENPQGV